MKKVVFLVCLMLSAALTFAQNTKKVAILEVVDREGRVPFGQKMMLRNNLAGAVTTTIGYEAFDRTEMDAILSEHDFQKTGLVSEEEIRTLNYMTGAQYVLIVEVARIDAQNLYVTAKLIDVKTAKIEKTENQQMGNDTQSITEGCMALADKLFKNDVSNYQLHYKNQKEYEYMGVTLNKKEYVRFLELNCPEAYKSYLKGKKIETAGWWWFGTSMTFVAAGSIWAIFDNIQANSRPAYKRGEYDVPIYCMIGCGGVCALASGAIMVPIGRARQKNAYKIYNQSCMSTYNAPLTFNFTTGVNGIGLSIQF